MTEPSAEDSGQQDKRNWKIHKWITVGLQLALLVGVVLAVMEGRWLDGVVTTAIIAITFLPLVLGRRFEISIPPEFELLAVVFVYASLFLGEVHGYYVRFWWWDVLLHTGSGLLLGIVGFLLVYVLNEQKEVQLHMRPSFVALFAFMFAMGLGALWEIFEFAMDQLFGLNMQKSGLVDTMWDLIVDMIGSLIIALLGWGFLRTRKVDSFLERWIETFIEDNPRLFRRRR